MHDGGAERRLLVAGPLHRAEFVELGKGHAGKGRRQRRDLVHDFGRVRIVHLIAQSPGEAEGDFPVFQAVARRHHLADPLNAAFGIGEGAVLFQEGRSRKEHMRVVRRLVQEKIVDDDTFHRRQRRDDVLGVGIGLQDVLALHV